jgi:hypothetical protein
VFDFIQSSCVAQMVLIHVDCCCHVLKVEPVLTLGCLYNCVSVRLTDSTLSEIGGMVGAIS